MTIVNVYSRVVNKLEASMTDDDRVVIYDCHMFIVHATEAWIESSIMSGGGAHALRVRFTE
jgi:hypothetical protein